MPTQWQALCEAPDIDKRDLAHLRTTSWGAAPATDKLLRRMGEAFPDALNVAVFGQTEMSPITCVLEGKDALRKLGSVGKPVSTVAIRIVDDEMNDVEQGEVGEIVYQGTGLMEGYWDNPEATAEAFEGGWFHSGDLVRMDEEGFLYVVDRAKDMIISGGENIYCAEVENVLADHPDIAEVTVIGREHAKWGETPIAVVGRERSRRRSRHRGAPGVGRRAPGPLQAADRPGVRRRAAAQRRREGAQAHVARTAGLSVRFSEEAPWRR